jgi:hypothetical protein
MGAVCKTYAAQVEAGSDAPPLPMRGAPRPTMVTGRPVEGCNLRCSARQGQSWTAAEAQEIWNVRSESWTSLLNAVDAYRSTSSTPRGCWPTPANRRWKQARRHLIVDDAPL